MVPTRTSSSPCLQLTTNPDASPRRLRTASGPRAGKHTRRRSVVSHRGLHDCPIFLPPSAGNPSPPPSDNSSLLNSVFAQRSRRVLQVQRLRSKARQIRYARFPRAPPPFSKAEPMRPMWPAPRSPASLIAISARLGSITWHDMSKCAQRPAGRFRSCKILRALAKHRHVSTALHARIRRQALSKLVVLIGPASPMHLLAKYCADLARTAVVDGRRALIQGRMRVHLRPPTRT